MEPAELEYVGFWPRVGAAIIDTVIVLAVTTPLLLWIYGWGYFLDPGRALIAGPADVLISWVGPTVATVLFWRRRQATPGKMAIGAQVVDAISGLPLTAPQALVRSLAYFVSAIPLGLGFLWIAFDPRRQGWHDRIARSVVVRAKDRAARAVSFTSR
jgi:uncharacterized RDD family membrane protein YckC